MNDVTRILSQLESGDSSASDKLLPLVYEELRRLAASKLGNEKPGQTLQPTALVHEAFLRLVGNDAQTSWNSRGHFFSSAAEAMRRILIEQARRKQRVRHGGEFQRVELENWDSLESESNLLPGDLLALNDALERLEAKDAVRAEIVKLRFFAGLTIPQAAKAMSISVATAERYWTFARTWLFAELSDGTPAPEKK